MMFICHFSRGWQFRQTGILGQGRLSPYLLVVNIVKIKDHFRALAWHRTKEAAFDAGKVFARKVDGVLLPIIGERDGYLAAGGVVVFLVLEDAITEIHFFAALGAAGPRR